jgi:hypothetical protein
MAYIVQRNDHFYVVEYDGTDPHTGKDRRRWHPAGHNRDDAEAIAERVGEDRQAARVRSIGSLTVGAFLRDEWLPRRRLELRPSTARRYEWFVTNYIAPKDVDGSTRLRRVQRPMSRSAPRAMESTASVPRSVVSIRSVRPRGGAIRNWSRRTRTNACCSGVCRLPRSSIR